ncbi:MAG: MFS transporter, partial [Paracoccaceae bacterium]|nr:MFS transporter [Paracoccaceae bacterium]
MLRILANRTYRHLFAAQLIALIGTGLATVALGLLAYDLAGAEAGRVLGTALAIKMVAYVTLAPVAAALAERVPRRGMLVCLDLLRALVALALPFVTEVWQVYGLIFVLQAASAGFTPAFQATIPDVLQDEADYTRALSLSRLAYDLETLLSPILAAALLTVISFHALFAGTVIGFLISAVLVLTVVLPPPPVAAPRPIWQRTFRGMQLYLSVPRLRGVLALNLTVAAAGAMVIVNTVVIVRAGFGLGASEMALALAAYGAGSMVAALLLPQLLHAWEDRGVMLSAATLLVAGLGLGLLVSSFAALLALWAVLGFGYSAVQTPVGRLLRQSGAPADRPALFAAQFALSHGCWLLAYPLAGRVGGGGLGFGIMAGLALLGLGLAMRVWSRETPAHRHEGLPEDHPHLAAVPLDGTGHHRHAA